MTEDNVNKEKEGADKPTEDAGKGDKSETVKDTERIRAETEELEKALAEKANADARAKVGGVTEAGQSQKKPEEETPKEYRARVNKELAEGKTEFGN